MGAASANPYQYTGRENDSGAGPFDGDLYYNRARYYSPLLQRFMSQDPIDFGGGDANLCGYALNSPANLRDPTGHGGAIEININRTTITDQSTIGNLDVGGLPVGNTLELPPNNNASFTSSIPPGTYPASVAVSPDHGDLRINLSNVPGRWNIQIHTANTPNQILGCIAPGLSAGPNRVNQSLAAMVDVLNLSAAQEENDAAMGLGPDVILVNVQ